VTAKLSALLITKSDPIPDFPVGNMAVAVVVPPITPPSLYSLATLNADGTNNQAGNPNGTGTGMAGDCGHVR